MEIDIKKLNKLIKEIEKEYNTKPTEQNQGDCLNAEEGYSLLMERVKKYCKKQSKKTN